MFKGTRTAVRRLLDYLHEIDWAAIFGSALVMLFCFAVLIPVIRLTDAQKRPNQNQLTASPKAVSVQDASAQAVAYYTEVLAWFTALLAVVSAFELYFLNRSERTARTAADAALQSAHVATIQTKLTREMFYASYPPCIVLRNVSYLQDEDGNKILYSLVNKGGAPGKLVESRIISEWC
jgi:hypothetical protein